jgi:light-regulated signal transduction histidine kinase (bacteriophytochrome)
MATPQLVEHLVTGMVPAFRPSGLARPGLKPARHSERRDPAARELEAFSATVSHDLQAPLRQIAGFVELLDREAGPALTEPCRQYLADIGGAAAHMSALLESMVTYAREGHRGLQAASVDLDALAREVVADLSREAADRTIEWTIAPLPVVRGDGILLRQVLANLIGNAVKYTRPRDPARIEVGVAPPARAGEVAIFVRDNGVGFDMRLAHKLFTLFERLHPASQFAGTGLGLASVHRIVCRHGGRVWAAGAVDRGATFGFSLPVGQDSYASAYLTAAAGPPS